MHMTKKDQLETMQLARIERRTADLIIKTIRQLVDEQQLPIEAVAAGVIDGAIEALLAEHSFASTAKFCADCCERHLLCLATHGGEMH